MRVPVAPPAKPVAMTGWPSVFSVRATLTPLPPGIVVCSTVRWRRPRRKFGTDRDLSIAALRVTVMIMRPRCPRCERTAGGGRDGGEAATCRLASAKAPSPSTRTVRPRTSSRRWPNPASATAVAVTSATRSTVRPRQRTSIVPTRARAGSGPSSSSGAPTTRIVAGSPRRTVRGHGARRHQVDVLGLAVAQPCRRNAPAGAHRRRAPVAPQAVAQQRERVGVAGRLARIAEDGADDGHAVASGRADEHVARLLRAAGLHAVDRGDAAHEPVAVDERPAARAAGRASRAGGRSPRAGTGRGAGSARA